MTILTGYRRWRDRRAALPESKQIERDREDRIVRSPMSPLRLSVQSLDAGDPKQATQYWERACELTPQHVLTATDTIHVLIRLERLDELEALMVAGHARSPKCALYLEGLARLAEKRGQLDEALRWWSKFRKSRPAQKDGWLAGAACLKTAGRLEEAIACLEFAIIYFERDHGCRVGLARAREELGDWPRAMREWNFVAETLGLAEGYLGIARIYEQMKDLTGAQQQLMLGLTNLPYYMELLAALARVEELLGNFRSAAACWSDLRLFRPHIEIGYSEEIRCLLLAGQ